MIRIVFLVIMLCLTSFQIRVGFAANNGLCDDVNNDGIIEDVVSGGTYKCFVDMDGAQVVFHELYICETAPALATYQDNCSEIFSSSSGETVTFAPDEQTNLPLNKTLSLAPGTYQHFVIKIGPLIKDKMLVQFTTTKEGRDSTKTGTWCWTTNTEYVKSNRVVANSPIECGSSQPSGSAVGWAYQYASYLCSGGSLTTSRTMTHSVTGKTQSNYVVDLNNNLFSYSTSTCPSNASSFSDYAPRMIVFQPLGSPVDITPATTTIEISMGIKGYGRVQMAQSANANCSRTNDCVIALRSKAPEFVVTAR